MADYKGGYQIANLTRLDSDTQLNGENKKQFEFSRSWFNNGKKGEIKPTLFNIKTVDGECYYGFGVIRDMGDGTGFMISLTSDNRRIIFNVDLDVDTFDDAVINVTFVNFE